LLANAVPLKQVFYKGRRLMLSTRTKLLFSTGDLTSSLPLAIQMFFQLYFLTDVARLEPATAGWVLGLTRAWDAVNDPMVGLFSDRIRSKHGRRRVLLMYGAIPLGVFFALGWLVPPFSQFGLAAYYTIAIVLFDTMFTVVHVGYNSLTPSMTYDYDERSSLNGYRMAFSLTGTLAAIILATVLDDWLESETTRFAIIGCGIGIVAMIPPWIVCSVAKEPPNDEPSKLSLAASLKATLANRAFLMLMGIYLLSWTAASVLASMLVYFARYYMQLHEQANYFVLVAEGAAVLFVPLCVWAMGKLDKPRAYIIGVGFWCVVLILISQLGRESVTQAYVLAFLCGPGIATALVVPWSMVPDVIEYDQQRTGERREGAFYSLVAFFQKLGTGIALWGIGQALSASGYISPTDAVPVPIQPDSVVHMTRWILGPVNIVLLLASLPLAWKYPINRESHRRVVEELNMK